MVPNPVLYARQGFSIPQPPPGLELPPPTLLNDSRAPQIVAGNVVLQLVGTLVFAARVYSRLCLTKSWKLEDYLLSVAWVFASGYSVCQYGQVAHGAGHHLGIVLYNNRQDAVESQKWAYAAQLLLFPALALPKLSICEAYSRIFSQSLINRRTIQALIVLIAVPTIPFFFLSVFQCKPISVYWNEGRNPAKCGLVQFSMYYVHGGINAFADLALMVIVLPRVMELHVSSRQKAALIGIVSLGSLAVIAGIVRLVRVSIVLQKSNFDVSWDAYDVSIWTATEIYVSLVCAAAPGIKPLISLLLPKLLGTSLDTHRSHTTTGVRQAAAIELKNRRATIGSARTRRNTHDTILDEGEGPYTEIGRGFDRDSWDSRVKEVELEHEENPKNNRESGILIIQTNVHGT